MDPNAALLTLMQQTALRPTLFAANSRYYGLDIGTLTAADGTLVAYVRRRFVPVPESLTTAGFHTVVQGDRLDNLAAKYVGDPEQYWRICDANRAMRPEELIEAPGRALRIALASGVPGVTGA
jgi:nucleoid-associated protein YgaU